MVEAATNFRKSGFNNADSAMLAQVAAQYQNIADTAVSAGDAAASITSQIRAFGEDASFATTVINAYNEVANNFSVGTNDISNAMEIASSGMATYGNSFQQVIGLVTSGTEIMQGRASQVARGLSTIAARIVKNQDALAEYGIQVEKTDGSLKSTFDVLSELKPKWDAMTDAQRVALGDTLAGQNQYKVLASVLQNFQHAIDATNTALESAGSAAEENARYMESLEASENALKAEFEDFANRVLSKDVVKGFLEAGTSMLDFANNDVGAAITRISLLTTGMIGLTGIAGQTIGKIAEVGLQLKNLGVGGDSFLGMLASGKIALIVGGAVAAITLLAEAIRAIQNAYDEAHPSFEDANKNLQETQTEIQNTTTELEEYKKKLQELDAIDPKDRGSGWAEERAELETNVQTAEAYLEVLKQIEQAQTGKIEDSKYVTGYTGQNVGDYSNGYIGTEASGQLAVTESQVKAITAEYTTQEEAVMSISLALKDYITGWETFKDMSMDDVVAELSDQLSALGINVHSTVETISQSFDNMGALADKAADGFDELTKAEQDQATQYLSDYQAYVRGLIDSGNQLDAEQRREIQNFLNLSATSANFNRTQATTADTISFVASTFGITADSAANFAASIGYIDPTLTGVADKMVQLADGAWALKENCEQGADGLYYLKDGCDALAGSGDVAEEAISGIASSMAEVQSTTDQFVGALFNMNGELTTTGQAALTGNQGLWSLANAEAAANQQAAQTNFDNLVSEILSAGQAASWSAQQLAQMFAYAGLSTGAISSTYGDITTDKRAQMAYGAREFKSGENLQSYLTRVAKENLEKAIKESDALKNLGQNLGYTTGVGGGGGSSRKSAEEKAAEEAEKQAKKAQKAQEKAAKQSQQAYESAASSAEQAARQAAQAAEQAAEEAKQKILDSIQELKDASDDFWDSKTDAIEETNKELDRQKQLEEKLKALEEAKQKKILLYKNGQFQYDKDYGTIAKAQADYEETRDKIQRERELEQLEEMKDNATEIFNEMKDIVQNGGDVTQEMINNWLKNMAASGADYYDSNKKLLGEWLEWAKNALQTYGQGVVDAVNGYVSTSSLMSSGTYGSNAQGVVATDTNGARYLADRNSDKPLYWDKDGNFVGFTKAFWIDRFDEQIKLGNFGDYTKSADWLGKMPGTSVFDDWAEVLKYWAASKGDKLQGEVSDPYAFQDMLERFEAARIVLEKYRDIFDSLGYDDLVKKADAIAGINEKAVRAEARTYGAAAHPEDPFGWRSISAADWTTTEGKLYNLLNDIVSYESITGSRRAEDEDSFGKQYKRGTWALEARATSKLTHWHRSSEKKFTDAAGDYYPDIQYVSFNESALKKFYEDNEQAITELSEMWFNAKTDWERQAIHLEAEARRQARDYAGAILGYDIGGKSEDERAANRQAGGTMEARQQQKKNAKNIESIEEVLKAVEKGQDISDGYINSAKDYLANAIKENREASDKLYSDTEKAKLDSQNSQMQEIIDRMTNIQESGVSIKTDDLLEGEMTPWDESIYGSDDVDDWVRDTISEDADIEALRRQMELNAERWHGASEEMQAQLHKENERIAEDLKDLGVDLTYTGSTGKWSKNATGTRNFRGGLSLVGERGPEMRILGQGDNIIPANQTANLWKWSNTTPQQMLTTLSARNGGSNTSYAFDVSRIELPNVTDAKSFVQGLKNYALQYSYKR